MFTKKSIDAVMILIVALLVAVSAWLLVAMSGVWSLGVITLWIVRMLSIAIPIYALYVFYLRPRLKNRVAVYTVENDKVTPVE